jgi:cell wall-associated NlpC family hydrolase
VTATADHIHQLLAVPYRPHGRDLAGCDCWGLVRLVRQALRGDTLPSFGAVSPTSKRELTEAATSVIAARQFRPVQTPAPGAIATVWRGLLCHHVGVVVEADGRLAVLETGSRIGPRWLRLDDFQRLYLDVRFYDN